MQAEAMPTTPHPPQTQNVQSQKVRDCGSFSESPKEIFISLDCTCQLEKMYSLEVES